MTSLTPLPKDHAASLAKIPGEHFQGNVTYHDNEWRSEYVIDYCPSNEAEEAENEYRLVFSLTENADQVVASLGLEYHVAEQGMDANQPLPLDTLNAAKSELAKACDSWDLHKDALKLGSTYIERLFVLKNELTEQGAIEWQNPN